VPALDPQSLPRHLDRLYRVAWSLCGSPHDAEDLVQETCARVLARPRLLRGQDELAYLMTVLRNTFLTQRRTAARRPRTGSAALEESDPVDPKTGERPEEALQAREVFAVIAGLPERYRLALVAVDIAGLSYREAAGVLETKEATIATRVFRARQQVARKLAGEPESDLAGMLALDQSQTGPRLALGEQPAPQPGSAAKREPSPTGEPRPGKEPSPGEEPGSSEEPIPGEGPSLGEEPGSSEEPSSGKGPTPKDGAPARHAQWEGRPPRRRLTQRGHK
jgi:RNA polymerase sigma-70 factor, ECF subfamily